ncbi:MAG: PAS domain-containing protein [Lachnospiraceae bacterium]
MEKERTASELVEKFVNLIFIEKDFVQAACYLDEEIEWIGLCPGVIAHNRQQLLQIWRENHIETVKNYGQELRELSEKKLMPHVYLVTAGLAILHNRWEPVTQIRISVICKEEKDSFKICSMHSSILNNGLEKDRFNPAFLGKVKMQEERMKLLNTAINGGIAIFEYTDSLRFKHISEGIDEMLKFQPGEGLKAFQEHPMQMIHPEDRDFFQQTLEQAIKEESDLDATYRVKGKDERYYWVNFKANLIRNTSHRKVYYGMVLDVSKIKLIEQTEQKTVERYQALVDAIPGGVGLYRVGETVQPLFFSDKLADLCGLTREEYQSAAQEDSLVLIHPEDKKVLIRKITEAIETKQLLDCTYRLRQKDGSYRWVHLIGNQIQSEDEYPNFSGVFFDIDGQKKLEIEHWQSEEKFRLATENTDISFWTYNVEEESFYQTPGAIAHHGMGKIVKNVPESIIAKGYIKEESVDVLRQAIADIRAGKPYASGDIWLRKVNGEGYWCEHTEYTTIFDVDHKPISAYAVGKDVTKEKLEKQRYEEEKRYWDTALKEMISFYHLNLSTNEIMESSSKISTWEQLRAMGSVDQFFKKVAAHISKKEQKQAFKAIFTRKNLIKMFQEGHTEEEIEHLYQWDQGERRWLCTKVSIIQNPYTRAVEAFVHTFDIDEERINRAVMDSLSMLNNDFAVRINVNSGAYVVCASNEGKYIIHPPAEGNYDEQIRCYFDRYSMKGDHLNNVKTMLLSTVKQNLKGNKIYSTAARIQVKGVERIKLMEYAYMDEERRMIIQTTSDVTHVYEQEERQKAELEKALKAAECATAEKSLFLASMSHEIRTPLNGICGMINLMKQQPMNEGNEFLEKADFSAKHLSSLINDILDMSKIESGKIELKETPVARGEIANYAYMVIGPMAKEKNIEFRIEILGDPFTAVYVDSNRVKQILINLLSNAVKYTEKGGHVLLEATVKKLPQNQVRVTYLIKDDGVGMEESFAEHAFETFHRENRVTGQIGTGLGLAITKKLVDLMNGTIEIKSKVGVGTEITMVIVFDAVKEGECIEESNFQMVDGVRNYESLRFPGKRALIAEDNTINMQIAQLQLESMGLVVEKAQDGVEVVQHYLQHPEGYYDIIFMDIMMPKMDGLEATEQIRKSTHSDAGTIPIIAMTANAFNEDIHKSLENGMNYHLSKPFERVEIIRILAKEFSTKRSTEDDTE